MILNHGANCHARREGWEPEPLCRARTGLLKAVDGFFRRLSWLIMGVTLAIYYVTPLNPLGPRYAFA